MTSKIKFYLGLLVIIAGFLLVRVGLVFSDRLKGDSSGTANIFTPRQSPNTGNALTRDSDKDGLPDREEIIYGTDPFKPDTDSDGYLDGIEVATGHNPLDASDNDKTRPGNFGRKQSNLTDRTANLTVASLIGDDGNLDSSGVKTTGLDGIVMGLSTQATIMLSVDPIQDSEIRTIDDNSPEALENYASQVAPLIRNNVFNPNLLAKMGNSDADLQTAIDSYQQADQSLRSMNVPSSWKDTHKDLINTSEQFIKLAQALTNNQVEADPVKALFALKSMPDVLTALSRVSKQSTDLAKSQNLSSQTLNILLSR